MPAVASPVLSRPAAAEYIGVQPQTLAAWASTGRYDLPFVRVGRLCKYRLADLEAFLARRTVGSVDSDG